MSNKLVLFVLVLATATVLYAFFTIPPAQKQAKTVTTTTTLSPIDINDPSIVQATLFYNIQAEILDIKQTQQGMELTTSIRGSSIPSLVVKPDTEVFVTTSPQQIEKVPETSLKKYQNISMGLTYDLKSKKWSISRITIFASQTPVATQSATQIPTTNNPTPATASAK